MNAICPVRLTTHVFVVWIDRNFPVGSFDGSGYSLSHTHTHTHTRAHHSTQWFTESDRMERSQAAHRGANRESPLCPARLEITVYLCEVSKLYRSCLLIMTQHYTAFGSDNRCCMATTSAEDVNAPV